MRSFIRTALLAFIALSLIYFGKDAFTGKSEAAPAASAVKTAAPHKVIAYYLHGAARCTGCLRIEAWSAEAIKSRFSDELEKGKLEWLVLNTDETENEHFVTDFNLYTKSLVVADIREGKQVRWKNLEKVWDHLGDQNAFTSYVQNEVAQYLRDN